MDQDADPGGIVGAGVRNGGGVVGDYGAEPAEAVAGGAVVVFETVGGSVSVCLDMLKQVVRMLIYDDD